MKSGDMLVSWRLGPLASWRFPGYEQVMDDSGHIPVLGEAVMGLLAPRAGQVYVDCTVGRGGHAAMIGSRLAPGGRVVAMDADPANVAYTRERLVSLAVPVEVVHSSFVAAEAVCERAGLALPGADLLLADLGFASNQVDDAGRGLSFLRDGPLDMRLNPEGGTTAADLVNGLPESELADVLWRYGEERLSRKIARKIGGERQVRPILTTTHLAELVRAAYGRGLGHRGRPERTRGRQSAGRGGGSRIDPATRTFMALRIAVNGELEALEHLLMSLPRLVRPGGVAAIISFHSLEDRLVKQAFRALAGDAGWTLLTRKPVEADEPEIARNPRSRSAKLRAVRRGE